ncbi:MAG: glutathione S-transferase [Sphingomonadales bacterium]|nr:glutathione S-transferase [Sphingomonadales bacterium]PIX66882.1 MAG: glutathione S-transferase [Sphingomonadales bacterium CG_4_10_14_3_um_filter_58_15]NCO48215.1 glutathione S-transferase [Sphingomonadales bacterium]NCO99756.1 glutathione S-transferase [Sphingomonadales bacterium]NCP27439.1 glutathione S-transferase [Sphingomonadales bacterium]
MNGLPVLYSFRRCPYAMRARMALLISQTSVRLREVVLRDKPAEMVAASPKATVPVLILTDGLVVDESLAIMHWALEQKDPQGWLQGKAAAAELIAEADGPFKHHLDRYKYPVRYENVDALEHRAAGRAFLEKLDSLIQPLGQLMGARPTLADHAIFPFVRQFANHDRAWFDPLPLPALQKWLADHLASPLFKAAMQKYPQWKTGDPEPVFSLEDAAG